MSIKLKLLLIVLPSMLALTVTTALLLRQVSQRSVEGAARQVVASAGGALDQLEKGDVEKLDTALAALQSHPGLAEAFAARDRERLLALAAPIFKRLREQHDVTHWYFITPDQHVCFLRVHKPSLFGDVIDRATLKKSVKVNGLGAGKELGQTAFALRVVQPWVVGGKLLGYMELGEEIDHFLGRMKDQTGNDFGLLVEKKNLDPVVWAKTRGDKRNNWDDQPSTVVVNATTGDEGIVGFAEALGSLPDGGRVLESAEHGGRVLLRAVLPVQDAAGRKIGGLFVLHDITELHRGMVRDRDRVVALFVLAGVLLSIALLAVFQRLVFRRLTSMMATLEDVSARLAGGDYEAAKDYRPGGKDEIGAFETFFAQFLQVMGGSLRDLQARTRKAG